MEETDGRERDTVTETVALQQLLAAAEEEEGGDKAEEAWLPSRRSSNCGPEGCVIS